ncbi:MAG: biotin--[acetyl-CoA-carboxylase] ligase [Armatimonadetes bacterium]|nr:biotin--[acetyl-CoA-carboxylase] ligase [Armatimonadota bacterium]
MPQIVYLDEVGSTNDVALDLARRGEPEGTVVAAGRQLAGRGRRGREWWDEPGASVLMSVLLYPRLADAPRLAFVASVAVAECIKEMFGLEVSLKWPNDVLVGDKKLGGILVETAPVGDRTAAVVGIGINVAQRTFPVEIADTATSIALECEAVPDLATLTERLAESLMGNYSRFLAHGFEEITAHWRKYMWGVGLGVQISAEGGLIDGVIQGVDDGGALVMRDTSGAIRVIHAADTIKTSVRH